MILHLTITEHVCEAGAAVQVTEEIGFEVEHFQIDIHLIKNASLALLGTGFASDTRTLRMRDSRNSQFFPRLRRGNTGRGKLYSPIGDCSQIFSPFRFSGIVLNANNHSRNLTPARLGVLASKSYTS